MKKRSTISWVCEFAGRKSGYFAGSVVIAILGVACSFVPYLIIASIVKGLITGNNEPSYYLGLVLAMGVFWTLRVVLHSVSTTLSHVAIHSTYSEVLENSLHLSCQGYHSERYWMITAGPIRILSSKESTRWKQPWRMSSPNLRQIFYFQS